MQTITLGKSDIEISSIIMGMWQAGKQYWVGIDDGAILQAVDAAIDSGINTFDTAEEYGDGYSEQLLGKAVKRRRGEVLLLTKVFSNHLEYKQVLEACDRSLKNLRTDYIDLYQIHWPSGCWDSQVVPIEETMRAMNELKEKGKIRAIGVSNFSLDQLKEAKRFGAVDTLQPPYSIFWRNIEKELAPYCAANDISVLAYSPLAQGFLTGRFQKGHSFFKGDNRAANKLFADDVFDEVLGVVDALKSVASRRSITLAQLALAWVIQHKNTAAIAGTRNAEQIRDSAMAGKIELSQKEMSQIDEISRPVFERFMDDSVPWFWNP